MDDQPVDIWGDIPFDPGLAPIQPVGVNLPDISNIPGLNPPSSGVSTDSSGMSVVTVTGSQSTGIPPWVWLLLLGGALYLWSKD